MSIHAIPSDAQIDILRLSLARQLRMPSGVRYANGLNAVPTAIEFTPDLSGAEQTALATLITSAQAPARLRTSYAALHQWSIDAAAINAAGGTPTAVQLRALFDRFGKLCDGIADLLIERGLDS